MKPGYKTTEFYISIVAALVPVVNQYFNLNLSVETIATIVGPLAALVVSRGLAKTEHKN